MNKIVSSFDEAIADIFEGATVLVGGFGTRDGYPSYLIKALARRGTKNLTVVGCSTGYGHEIEKMPWMKRPPGWADVGILAENGQIRKAMASFTAGIVRSVRLPFEDALEGGAELEMVPQGTLALRIWAGKAGIPAFYCPTGVDTIIEEGKEVRVFNGRKHLLEYAIYGDFALIRAHKADRWGNLVYRGTSRTFNAVMAGAAKVTVAEVDEIVELGELDPESIVTPSVYVTRVVVRPKEDEK